MPRSMEQALRAGSRALRVVAAFVEEFDPDLTRVLRSDSHALEAFAAARELPTVANCPYCAPDEACALHHAAAR